MKKKLLSPAIMILFLIFLLPFVWSFKKSSKPACEEAAIPQDILHWLENKGQFEDPIKFARSTPQSNIQIRNNGEVVYHLKKGEHPFKIVEKWQNPTFKSIPRGLNKSATMIQYFKGHPSDFITDVHSFQKVTLGKPWSGIEIQLQSRKDHVEKLFILDKNAKAQDITIQLKGQEDLCINGEEALQLDLQDGSSVQFSPPIAWQEIDGKKDRIEVSYQITEEQNVYGFDLGDYDPQYKVYIDPILNSSFIGGSRFDFAHVLKIGKNDKIYVAGVTESNDLYVTEESFDPHFNDTTDMFVALYNKDMTLLEACTFLGGSGVDMVRDIALDTSDNVYLTGMTQSEDYPVSPNCFDDSYNNPGDAWFFDAMVSSLSDDLSDLRYSTYLGTSHTENANAIDIDSSQNIFITGLTFGNLPEVGAIFDNHVTDFFFIKFDHELQNILASNSLSGNNYISPRELVVDSSDQIVIVGDTWASDLPVGPQAFAPVNSGNRDGYIIRLNNKLDEILAATYYGGKMDEELHAVAVNRENTIYFSGNSTSTDLPLGDFPFDSLNTYGNIPNTDGIVAIMDSALTTLKSATYFGEKGDETAYDIAFDSLGNILITGYTTSTGLPAQCNSFDPDYNEGEDAFITKFSDDLKEVLAFTYVGGSKSDHAYSIECNKGDSVFIAGYTTSIDFPINQPVDAIFDGGPSDGFVFSIDPELDKLYPCCGELLYPVPHTVIEPGSILLEWSAALGANGYLLSIGNDPDTFNLLYQADMEESMEYILSDLNCNDTIFVLIQAYNDEGFDPACSHTWFTTRESFLSSETAEICEGESLEWQDSTYTEAGSFEVVYTDQLGCDSTYQLELSVFPSYYEYEFVEICEDDYYQWQGNFLQTAGTYLENYTTEMGCDSIFELELVVHSVYDLLDEATICEGDSYLWEGLSLTLPGTYTNHLVTSDGCDSTINLTLNVLDTYTFFDTLSICPDDTLIWHGNAYNNPGDYQKNYTSNEGCDSTYNLALSHLPDYEFNEFHSMCLGDTFWWQGMTLIEAGYYEQSYSAINSCDSSYTLDLAIPMPDTMVFTSENTLFVDYDQNSSYQWVTCADYKAIDGETNPVFEIDSSGTYAVIVEKSGCVDTSSCVTIIHTGLEEIETESSITVYPNPLNQQDLTVKVSKPGNGYQVALFSLEGKKLFDEFSGTHTLKIPTHTYVPGVYWLKYQKENQTLVRKVVIQK